MPDDGDNEKKDKSNREEELKRLQDRRSELVGGITETEKHSAEVVKEITDYTEKIIDDYSKDVGVLKDFGKKVETKAVESFGNVADMARNTINSALGYFRIYFAIVICCLGVVGALGNYLFLVYVPTLANGFLVTWLTLSAITVISLWFMRRSLSKKPSLLDKQVSDNANEIAKITSSRPQLTHDLTPMKRLAKAATSGIKQLAKNALEIVPTGDKIIEHQNKTIRQQKFVENFVFAIGRYNIDVTTEAQEVMVTHSWLVDDKVEWLKDLSKEMADIYKDIDSRAFQLMYLEFFDEKYAEPLWKEIRDDADIRMQISGILIGRKLVDVPDEKTSIPILSELLRRSPTYSLDDIKIKSSSFFHDLAEFKQACIRHLGPYGLNIIEKKDLLSEYVPRSADLNKWRAEVVKYIAEHIISKEPIHVKLLIESAEGDEETEKTWKSILETGQLEKLAMILAKRIHLRFRDFDRDTFSKHLQLAMASNADDFSLSEIEITLESIESEILSTKYRIQHMLDEFRLSPLNLDFVGRFTPSKRSDIEPELVKLISDMLKKDCDVLTMMYYAANGLEKARELFAALVKSPKAKILAEILIEKKLIANSSFSVNAVRMLQTQDSFNLGGFIALYTRYEALSESLVTFYQFLQAMGVCKRSQLQIEDILRICPVSNAVPLENQLVKLSYELVAKNLDGLELNMEQHVNLALASTALFLRTHGYSYSTICQTASQNGFATKVLFQYITLVAEQGLSGSGGLLKEATRRAIYGSVDVANYDYFKSELEDGKLAPSAAYLFSQFKQEVKTEFKKLEEMGFETKALANYVDSIKELLYQQIDENVVREFLLAQVLSAFLLTVPGNVPGIGFVRDDLKYIRLAEDKLASEKNDPSFRNLVRVTKGGGKATRIGLVPSELSFEDFSAKFNEVWSYGVRLHNKAEKEKLPVPLPCYILRIFPSSDGLKEIMPSEDIGVKPLEIVRELIRDTVRGEDSVSLLSLLQKTSNGKLALLSVIQAIFDSPKSNLLTLIRDQALDILSRSKNVSKKFERKEIDSSLFDAYKVKRISLIGKAIAEREVMAGQDVARNEFRERLIQAIGDTTGISNSDIEILVGVLFRRLHILGIPSII